MARCAYYLFRVPEGGTCKDAVRVDCPNESAGLVEQTGSAYPDLNGPIEACAGCARLVAAQNHVNALLSGNAPD